MKLMLVSEGEIYLTKEHQLTRLLHTTLLLLCYRLEI